MSKSSKILAVPFFVLILFLMMPAQKARAQMGSMEGDIKDENGSPMVGVLVTIDRTDIKGHYQVPTDKKGHFFHAGLPPVVYKVSLVVDGKVIFFVNNVKVPVKDTVVQDIDLKKEKEKAASQPQRLTKEQQEAMAKQAESVKKFGNMKALFEKGTELKNQADNLKAPPTDPAAPTKDQLYAQAIDAFKQAVELDPKQTAIHAQLAESYKSIKKYDDSIESYNKALALLAEKPNPQVEASYHVNLGIIYGTLDKLDNAKVEMEKAAQLAPALASKAFFNLGVLLENKGKSDEAAAAYKRAIEADPKFASGYYRLGICLTAKATIGADGKMVAAPGTVEAFQKYLEIEPTGSYAAESKAMLDTFAQTVETQFKSKPAAKTDKGKKK
jgi:tetratricopeptide (TPR) repeat protein